MRKGPLYSLGVGVAADNFVTAGDCLLAATALEKALEASFGRKICAAGFGFGFRDLVWDLPVASPEPFLEVVRREMLSRGLDGYLSTFKVGPDGREMQGTRKRETVKDGAIYVNARV